MCFQLDKTILSKPEMKNVSWMETFPTYVPTMFGVQD